MQYNESISIGVLDDQIALSIIANLIANAIGLLVATLLLAGFRIDFVAFLLVVIIFSIVQALLVPITRKIASRHAPQLLGGIALVTIFLVLGITDLLTTGMQIGGIANWLAATLLIWIGSLVATILLPIYVLKGLREGANDPAASWGMRLMLKDKLRHAPHGDDGSWSF